MEAFLSWAAVQGRGGSGGLAHSGANTSTLMDEAQWFTERGSLRQAALGVYLAAVPGAPTANTAQAGTKECEASGCFPRSRCTPLVSACYSPAASPPSWSSAAAASMMHPVSAAAALHPVGVSPC
ncbi:unnamed protein product [Lota lota]